MVGYTALLSVFAYICLELPWLNTEKFIFGLILKPNKKWIKVLINLISWNVSMYSMYSIVWCIKNRNYLRVGHFMTLSGLFFCQLHYYLSKNWGSDDHFDVPNMPKSYLDQRLQHKTWFPVFCNFVRKNTENLWLINGHFRTISGHFLANYMKIFHKKEV